jgi:4a-hydroxytetrahydrobiopterin dehydratase
MDKDNVECWTTKDHPPGLFRRFEFENYGKLRIFLDRLAELSKEKEYYPDISFGVTYANITVYASDAEVLSDEDKAFSHSVDELI